VQIRFAPGQSPQIMRSRHDPERYWRVPPAPS